MAERLTHREGKHTIRVGNEWRRHDPVWDKLAHYEDLEEQYIKETTFPLRLILDKFIEFQNDIEELIRYRELEEWGRLIELPCAVGDTVYDIAGKEIRKQIVDGIEYMADGFFIYANEDEWIGSFGDLVFLTKEEALAKLKERGEQE